MARRVPAALREFLGAYAPAIRRLHLATRRVVLDAAPQANELIYDAYNTVTVAYSFSDALGDAFCHVAAYRGHVNLGFNRGAELHDPDRLLIGSGARIRHVRVSVAADLERPALRRLLQEAVAQGRTLVGTSAGDGRAIVMPVSGRKRR